MNRFFSNILILVIVVFEFISAQGMYIFNKDRRPLLPNHVDLRSLGMGKTGVVNKSGSSSLFINPSCLAAMDSFNISTGVDLYFGSNSNPKLADSLKIQQADFESRNMPPNFTLNHLAFGIPFHFQNGVNPINIGIGLGYYSPYNLNNNYKSTIKFPLENVEIREKMRGGIHVVSFGIGLAFMDKYYLGIALNKSIVNQLSIYREVFDIPKNGNKDEIKTTYKIHNDAFFHSFGAMVQPMQNLSIGMKIITKFKWDFDTYKYELEDSLAKFNKGRVDKEITMPPLYAFGIEYIIIPAITLTFEYQTRLFEYFLVNGEEFIEEADIDNGFSINFGSEVKAGNIPIRLGAFLESLPITDYHYKPFKRSDKPITMFGLTSGFGVPIKAVALDFGFSWSYYHREECDTSSTGVEYYYKHAKNNFNIDFGISTQFRIKKTKTKEMKNEAPPKSIPVSAKEKKTLDSTLSKDAADTPSRIVDKKSSKAPITDSKNSLKENIPLRTSPAAPITNVPDKTNEIKKEQPAAKPQGESVIQQDIKTEKLKQEKDPAEQDTSITLWEIEEKPVPLKESSESNDSLPQNTEKKKVEEKQRSVSQDTLTPVNQTVPSHEPEKSKEDILSKEKEKEQEKEKKSDNLWADDDNLFETPIIKAGDFVSLTLVSGKEFKGTVEDANDERYILNIEGEKITFYRVAIQSIEKR